MKSIKYTAMAYLLVSAMSMQAMLPHFATTQDIYKEAEEPCSVIRSPKKEQPTISDQDKTKEDAEKQTAAKLAAAANTSK
jgi:hypothetical protein